MKNISFCFLTTLLINFEFAHVFLYLPLIHWSDFYLPGNHIFDEFVNLKLFKCGRVHIKEKKFYTIHKINIKYSPFSQHICIGTSSQARFLGTGSPAVYNTAQHPFLGAHSHWKKEPISRTSKEKIYFLRWYEH